MLRLATIVGARPQFIKAAALSRAIGAARGIAETLIHTGQHYDAGMSAVFFAELDLPEPAQNLGVGSGTHAEQTAAMLCRLEAALADLKPDLVLVYGDTNSTLAGALAAAKACLPLAHVEAGLRSGNRRMPEEINRIVTDRLADLLFTGTAAARRNLETEGLTAAVREVGDVMYDCVRLFRARIPAATAAAPYALATLHRAENTDDPARLAAIVAGLAAVGDGAGLDIVLPLHPRTKAALGALAPPLDTRRLRITDPVSYLDMMGLEAGARIILTDSGGVQKEAFFHGVPCVTLRDETEWVETVESGWNRLAPAEPGAIAAAATAMLALDRTRPRPPFYGDGHAAEKIVAALLAWQGGRP